MSIWIQLTDLIHRTTSRSPPPLPPATANSVLEQIIRHWTSQTPRQKQTAILGSALIALAYYILAPSLFPPSEQERAMFTKRPDKHTTGLINLRNDCFANSSLQAYLSLPGLTDYLNSFIDSFHQLQSLSPQTAKEDYAVETEGEDASKEKGRNKKPTVFGIPLHIALARIMKKLQDTQMTTRTVSVWTFLHELETIFHAKISRSQHDAHELTQLINETLENENLRVQKRLKLLLADKLVSPVLVEQLESLEIPEFPLSGLILTQMVCLTCKHVLKPSFSPFLMLTLHTPEKVSTDLDKILDENESETIDGYQCLKCRLQRIVQNEEYAKRSEFEEGEQEYLSQIASLNNDSQLSINEDLSEGLESYVKSYNKNGTDISMVTSTVLRKNLILKPPKIFGIHLSRSSFDGVSATRNACRVSFKDQMTLSIGKEYFEELKQFQNAARDDESDAIIKSNVLTTDVNDMEDEDVQREDVDEKGEEDEDDSEVTSSSATEGEEDLDGDETDSDASSLTSQESISESIATTATLKGGSTAPPLVFSRQTAKKPVETLNNAPITEDQTDDLKEHFKSFKFNENDVYKYKLKALIRHQGSHTQGHYECYKRKPLFVKDKEGNIFKLSPEISDESIEDGVHCSVSIEKPEDVNSAAGKENESSKRSNSVSLEEHLKFHNAIETGDIKGIGGTPFRRKLSNMMGRRPSIFQADPQDIHEIIHSGLTTPAELLIENPEPDYFSARPSAFEKKNVQEKERVKMTKIPSLIKNPYWRISDSQITEVSRSAVLCETTSVYMLYYERVDRKQIKSRR